MRQLIPIYSKKAPNVKNSLWLKPVTGGFVAYILDGGQWLPEKISSTNGTADPGDDTANNAESIKSELIGGAQDSDSKNTIYGAKAYAKDKTDALMGTDSDTYADMSLYGLKAYIDKKIEDITPSVESEP